MTTPGGRTGSAESVRHSIPSTTNAWRWGKSRAGCSVLVVRMEPALDADLTKETAPRTYLGPARFTPDTSAVVELVRTGGFEAVLTWAVGVDAERPFRVTRLEQPARIVLDVATG